MKYVLKAKRKAASEKNVKVSFAIDLFQQIVREQEVSLSVFYLLLGNENLFTLKIKIPTMTENKDIKF